MRDIVEQPGTHQAPSAGQADLRPARRPHYILVDDEAENVLLAQLLPELKQAVRLDIGIAFPTQVGLHHLEPHLKTFLVSGGRLRILAGDYLQVNDPAALQRLVESIPLVDRASPGLEVRAFRTEHSPGQLAFRTYLLEDAHGRGTVYLGRPDPSRLSAKGIPWTYQVFSPSDNDSFGEWAAAFEQLFTHPYTTPVALDAPPDTHSDETPGAPNIRTTIPAGRTGAKTPPPEGPMPSDIQCEALAALNATRSAGNRTGLVVLAPRLGKTTLAALDCKQLDAGRVLYVTHRETVVAQAMAEFRTLLPHSPHGLLAAEQQAADPAFLFTSVQALNSIENLATYDRHWFDYIVIDDFTRDYVAAYARLTDWFRPMFLLGLSSIPETSEGGNLLALCQENLAYRCDVLEAIRRGKLRPFNYFGVPDSHLDYATVPRRRNSLDLQRLETAACTQERATQAFQQVSARGGSRILVFCVSSKHADFVARCFSQRGMHAVAIHSGSSSADRAGTLAMLHRGEVRAVCTVDPFADDLMSAKLDTLVFLRPAETLLRWMYQLSPGLVSQQQGQSRVNVIDFIGNDLSFLNHVQGILGLPTRQLPTLQELLSGLRGKPGDVVPASCQVNLDHGAVAILEKMLPSRVSAESPLDGLRAHYQYIRTLTGSRPTATELLHDGLDPACQPLQSKYGSWLEFVNAKGDLLPEQASALQQVLPLVRALDAATSFPIAQVLLLRQLLSSESHSARTSLDDLVAQVRDRIESSARLAHNFRSCLDIPGGLEKTLERSLESLSTVKGPGGRLLFSRGPSIVHWLPTAPALLSACASSLVLEILEWKLAAFLSSQEEVQDEVPPAATPRANSFILTATRLRSTPVLALVAPVPAAFLNGNQSVLVDGTPHLTKVEHDMVLNLWRRDDPRNVLGATLRSWFGPTVGAAGTHHEVLATEGPGCWTLTPQVSPGVTQLLFGGGYSREQIPRFFGLRYNQATWNTGYVRAGENIFLLVTLEKAGIASSFHYNDRFLSRTEFQWQSQNRTHQLDSDGRILRTHKENKVRVHLFVRHAKKDKAVTVPFTYCGEVEFLRWEGNNPITIWWKMQPVPDEIWSVLHLA